jgi:dipeptidyl aminopeptidase/acylaminoacyl peptidase
VPVVINPNVRGSTGYGKTFSQLANGFLRENTYKDIGALLDRIGQQPDLDARRVMVTGASYGGHVTIALATRYSDRISCSVDVVGISNLVTFLEHTESNRRGATSAAWSTATSAIPRYGLIWRVSRR